MTDTITTRPTPARDLKPGDRIRRDGEIEKISCKRWIGQDGVVLWVGGCFYGSFRGTDIFDVVVDTTDPEPEKPAWPTAPLIRITQTGYDWDNTPASGYLALRTGGGNYLDADDVDYFQKDAAIIEWEDLTPIRTSLIEDLREVHTLITLQEDGWTDSTVADLIAAALAVIDDAERSQP